MSNLSEFKISIRKLPPAGEWIELPVQSGDLGILADEIGVMSCSELKAKFRVKRYRKHGVTVIGEFFARIEQECIATLDPVNSHIKGGFDRQFLPQQESDYTVPEIIDGEIVLDPEADDIPDLLEGDEINLWEVLSEEMILAINPFPRSDNAPKQTAQTPKKEEVLDDNPTYKPFSDLKSLITEKKSNK